jgi:hypothetical protein
MISSWLQLYKFFWPGFVAGIYVFGAFGWAYFRSSHASRFPNDLVTKYARFFWIASGSIFVIWLSAEAIYYLFWPGYVNHIESTIVSVAWLADNGMPPYERPDSEFPYSLPYGPLLFIVEGWLLKLFGPSLVASKLGGALGLPLGLALLWIAVRRAGGENRQAIVSMGLVSLGYLLFGTAPYETHANGFILTLTSASLALATAPASILAAALLGLTAGCLINLKLHAALYALPALGYYLGRAARPKRDIFILAGFALGAVSAPFLLGGVSLSQYIAVLRITAMHGLSVDELVPNVLFGAALIAPLVWVLVSGGLGGGRSAIISIYGYVVGLSLVVVIASKPGAGPVHLMPELPNLAFLLCAIVSRRPSDPSGRRLQYEFLMGCATILVLLPILFNIQRLVFTKIGDFSAAGRHVTELNVFLNEFDKDDVAMGYGDDQHQLLSNLRPLLTFRGAPMRFEPSVIMDRILSGETVFKKTDYDDFSRCRPEIWIIPKGGEPFSISNGYTQQDLFPDEFRQSFLANYRPVRSGNYFDAWECTNKIR